MSAPDKRPLVAYRLTPVREPHPDQWSGSVSMVSWATGQTLMPIGGAGGMFLEPFIVDALKNEGVPKGVVVVSELEGLQKDSADLVTVTAALRQLECGTLSAEGAAAVARQALVDIGAPLGDTLGAHSPQ